MANEKGAKTEGDNLPKLSYDWNMLAPIQVVAQHLSQGEDGIPYAQKSLELILKDTKNNDPAINNVLKDPEVLPKIFKSYNDTYNQFRSEQTVGGFLKYHGNDLTKYLGEDSERVPEELAPFMNMKYSDLGKKIGELKYIIDGKKYGKTSDDEVKVAEEEMAKYQKVTQTLSRLEAPVLARFNVRVEEELSKDVLGALYPKPKTEEQAEAA